MESKRKFSILIVDDDPGMGETMADILGDMGYGAYIAEDGYRAIEMIKDAIALNIKSRIKVGDPIPIESDLIQTEVSIAV